MMRRCYRRDCLTATTTVKTTMAKMMNMTRTMQELDGFALPKHGSYGGLHIGALFHTMVGVEDDIIFSGNRFTTKNTIVNNLSNSNQSLATTGALTNF